MLRCFIYNRPLNATVTELFLAEIFYFGTSHTTSITEFWPPQAKNTNLFYFGYQIGVPQTIFGDVCQISIEYRC